VTGSDVIKCRALESVILSCDKLVGLLDPCLTFVYNTTGKINQVWASLGISVVSQS
jgi:hypothetical protein